MSKMSYKDKLIHHHSYEKCSEYERQKLQLGYRRIAEYENYYLYAKYNRDNVFLYRECFSKFDIDGVKPTPKQKGGPWLNHIRAV